MKLKDVILISGLLSAILFSGCSSKNENYVLFNKKQQVEAVNDLPSLNRSNYETRIVPNNRLSILVFNHPELSTRDVRAQIAPRDERGVLVSSDGTIDLPLIGVVRVAGLTTRGISNLLHKEYSRYIKHAHVTVDLLNKRVFVLGEVRRPGRLDISEETTTLLEALANAGDLTDFAEKNSIKIIRGTREKPEVETVDLTRLSSLSSNKLVLFPNDVVYVAPNEYKQKNMAIAEALPGIDIVGRVLGILFTGKQLTNTHVFETNTYVGN